MTRRLLSFALAFGLAALAVALAPWTVSTSALVARIDGQLEDAFGLDLEVKGRTTIAFLPVPRVKFEDFVLRAANGGQTLVEGTYLRGELRVLPLLFGRLSLSEVSIAGATVDATIAEGGATPWARAVASLRATVERGRFEGRSQIGRVVINQSDVMIRETGRTPVRLQEVNLVASWERPDGPLDLGGSLRWRGEVVTFAVADLNPHAVASGRTSAVSARLTGPGARLVLAGTAGGPGDLRATGQSTLELRSARDFARWSGLDLPLAPMIELLGVDGAFEVTADALSWRNVRVTLGADILEGALMARLDRGRLALNGTLATERLDLSPFLAPFSHAQTGSGSWSEDELQLEAQTRADLDLRISATTARAGLLRLEEMGLSLLVKAGRIEASLGRSTLNRGGVRARLALAATPGGVDLRAQGTFERVDVSSLLGDLRQARWIAGGLQGQFALESVGASPAEIVRNLHGRAGAMVRAGEIVGAGLPEALRRVERRPLSASLEWRNGRTPFDQFAVQLAVANGVGVVSEGTVASPAIRGALQGRLSLVDRSVAARAIFEAASGAPGTATAPAIAFDLSGPWHDVAVLPDARALIERSGAARSLLPEVRIESLGGTSRIRESVAQ